MISIARYGFVIFLFLLQIASPLIHAHKNGGDFAGVLHLPEFEQINSLLTQDTPMFVIINTQNDDIVTISESIKNQVRILKSEPLNLFVLSLFFIAVTQTCLRRLFNQIAPNTNFHFFNLASPRAPPILSFSLNFIVTHFEIYLGIIYEKENYHCQRIKLVGI